MIFDRIDLAERYMGISPELDAALKGIGAFAAKYQPRTRVDGDGDRLYANCMQYESSKDPERLWESHRDYIDIHVVIRGEEVVQLVAPERAATHAEYDASIEAVLYHAEADVSVPLAEGSFAVFFPGEVHRAGVALGEPASVSKMVIKVRYAVEQAP